jgi:hypothetical protein
MPWAVSLAFILAFVMLLSGFMSAAKRSEGFEVLGVLRDDVDAVDERVSKLEGGVGVLETGIATTSTQLQADLLTHKDATTAAVTAQSVQQAVKNTEIGGRIDRLETRVTGSEEKIGAQGKSFADLSSQFLTLDQSMARKDTVDMLSSQFELLKKSFSTKFTDDSLTLGNYSIKRLPTNELQMCDVQANRCVPLQMSQMFAPVPAPPPQPSPPQPAAAAPPPPPAVTAAA